MDDLYTRFKSTFIFLRNSVVYFRDVLLLHFFMLFIFIPALSSSTKFILQQGSIPYLSFDNLPVILAKHPFVFAALLFILLLILAAVFFEFTFLLLSVYFIQKKQTVTLRQLLYASFLPLKKLRSKTFLFFLFYFFLVLPIGGLSFHSDLLAKIKIPAFLLDFIFANRVTVISLFVLCYICLLYLGVRLVFALSEMILWNQSFRKSVRHSLQLTKRYFWAIVTRLGVVWGSILLLTSLSFFLILGFQRIVDYYWSTHAIYVAVLSMFLLQLVMLLNLVLSTIGTFYVILDFLEDKQLLPDLPEWLTKQPVLLPRLEWVNTALVSILTAFFGISVVIYNLTYLKSVNIKIPIAISHRGVSNANAVQNSLEALIKTSTETQPDYVEMDIQQTADGVFVVMHDFNLKALTNLNQKVEAITYAELEDLIVKENNMAAKIPTFDDYLATANKLNQKLLIEIKTQKKEITALVDDFLTNYHASIKAHGHTVQSLTYNIVEQVKEKAPDILTGYILPFNIVGPPLTKADFLTMEYSTINQNFVSAAHADGKAVYVWTPNKEADISRMRFYGVDGIVTDQMELLNKSINTPHDTLTYADKLANFVIGIG